MEADWKRVTLKQADADSKKVRGHLPGRYRPTTRRSRSVRRNYQDQKPKVQYLISPEGSQFHRQLAGGMTAYFQVMQIYGTGLRLALIRAAAKKWGVNEDDCRAEKHKVYGPKGQSTDYRWLLLARRKKSRDYEEIVKRSRNARTSAISAKGRADAFIRRARHGAWNTVTAPTSTFPAC